jgi:hypothetical protein
MSSLCNVLPPLTLHRWSVEDYSRMIDSGVLTSDDRVELIEGEIVELAPIGSVHGASVDALSSFLTRAVGSSYQLRVQGQVQLPPRSHPRPDLAVLLARPDRYRSAQPGPSDVMLVIEVADSSLATARARKIPMYGRASPKPGSSIWRPRSSSPTGSPLGPATSGTRPTGAASSSSRARLRACGCRSTSRSRSRSRSTAEAGSESYRSIVEFVARLSSDGPPGGLGVPSRLCVPDEPMEATVLRSTPDTCASWRIDATALCATRILS